MILNSLFFCLCSYFFSSLNAAVVCPLTQKEAYENSWTMRNYDGHFDEKPFMDNLASFDYDPEQKKIVALATDGHVFVYSNPRNGRFIYTKSENAHEWNKRYRQGIVFHNKQIFFI